jgi:lysozyme family protein
MTNIVRLKAANAARWHAMHMRASRIPAFDGIAHRLCAAPAKARYQAISDGTARVIDGKPTQVPWFAIAVIHEREASQRWDRQLGQGDPLDQVSRNDPRGRGPFLNHASDTPLHDAFYRAALDALLDCAPYAGRWTDWSAGGLLTLLEEYNGLGYAARGAPSAYVWSGTDQYSSGKFVADHVYRPGVVDVQEGCAPILARMMAIDDSVKFAEAA